MRVRAGALGTSLILVAGVCATVVAQTTDPGEAAIRAGRDKWNRAIENRDAAVLRELSGERFHGIDGAGHASGRDEAAAFFTRLFKQRPDLFYGWRPVCPDTCRRGPWPRVRIWRVGGTLEGTDRDDGNARDILRIVAANRRPVDDRRRSADARIVCRQRLLQAALSDWHRSALKAGTG